MERVTFVAGMQELLGKTNFIYGLYRSEPKVPYGFYQRVSSNNKFFDDKVYQKINTYEMRVVTDYKDFELEKQIEDLMDDLGITYNVVHEEDITKEKVHVVEWEFDLVE